MTQGLALFANLPLPGLHITDQHANHFCVTITRDQELANTKEVRFHIVFTTNTGQVHTLDHTMYVVDQDPEHNNLSTVG